MKKRKNNILIYLFAAVALAMASCNRLPIYSHYEHVGDEGWSRTDTLHFHIGVKEPGTYNVMLGLRANSSFPYTQIMLVVHSKEMKDKTEQVDSLLLDITDTEGHVLGNGISFYQYNQQLTTVSMQKKDSLFISVSHAMSRMLLPGIVDVGITISKTEWGIEN